VRLDEYTEAIAREYDGTNGVERTHTTCLRCRAPMHAERWNSMYGTSRVCPKCEIEIEALARTSPTTPEVGEVSGGNLTHRQR